MSKAVAQLMATARAVAVTKAPYFARSLGRIVPRPVEGFGTWGITDKGVMLYDPKVTQAWATKYGMLAISGLALHEMLHWVCVHGQRVGDRDPKRWNVAADLWINGTLRAAGVAPPTCGVYPEDYLDQAGQPFPEGLTADAYYALLASSSESESGKAKGVEAAAAAERGEGMPARGECGSGAGNPIEGEPGDGGTAPGEDGLTYTGRSSMEQVTAASALAEDVRKHVRGQGRGSVPGGLDRWADDVLGAPRVPWPVTMGRHARPWLEKAGRGRRTYRRISRMTACLGGGVLIPARSAQRVLVWFVIDTSGSMSHANVAQGLTELEGLCNRPGVEVCVFSCDAQISGPPQPVKCWRDAVNAIKGGGGTDFRPIAQLYEDTPREQRPAMIACYTDGDGPAPAAKPNGVEWLWVLSSDYGRPGRPATWGSTVVLDGVIS